MSIAIGSFVGWSAARPARRIRGLLNREGWLWQRRAFACGAQRRADASGTP
jgi:hypothetical protein